MYAPSKLNAALLSLLCLGPGCATEDAGRSQSEEGQAKATVLLQAVQDQEAGTIAIYGGEGAEPILTQNARSDHRPYLHPIVAPDGNGHVTEYSPGHHPHQTGLYWGFTRVNGETVPEETLRQWFYRRDKPEDIARAIGRDFFHNPGADFWRLKEASVVTASGEEVRWRTVYDMLDENGSAFLTETQSWTLRLDRKHDRDRYLLDLEWTGDAHSDVVVNEFEYGGMFLRMPWREGIAGEAVNAARKRNRGAEGQRAMWVDVGMQVDGRDDFVHVAMFDHPTNAGFPQPWRVDGQLGVGPVRARLGDWHIQEGTSGIIRHRLVIYTGELNDLELTEEWQEYSGSYYTAALWDLAQEEARQEKFLTADEAADSMTLLDGFEVNAWASEPMITQPMAFAWDDRGRLWIAENRDYENRRTGFSNSGDSKILILEDTDRDGTADSRKVFLEGVPFPSALAIGFDGVFLGAPPHLLFVPDRDGDDRGEMEDAEILLTGWGIRDRHETINSFHWGPDGWLYGLEGFATPSKIRKPEPGAKMYGHMDEFPADLLEAEGVDINGGVWRYHPTKKLFEVVAHGFSNPWGIDYDAKGQIFISACVIPHLFHVVPGGIYHRQGGQHFNPYVYQDIRTIVNHRHRSAHGGARLYLSDAFPREHHGHLFMANIHEHAVLSDRLEAQGSGFVAHHADDFLLANNAQWVGFSMEIGPAGEVFVLDWHDADICGSDVHHKETGRIYRVTPTRSLASDWPGRYDDLGAMSDLELVELQLSQSAWHARRARVILQSRAAAVVDDRRSTLDPAAQRRLREIFESNPDGDLRLRAMWALFVTGGFTPDQLTEVLADPDPHVRAWAIQFLCEDKVPPAEALRELAEMAENDESAVVRLYLAAALQRLEHDARWPIAEALARHGEDALDHNIPKMLWFGIEPLVPEDPRRALHLAIEAEIPMLAEHIARRAVDADELETLVTSLERRSDARPDLLRGMRAGLEGRFDVSPPGNWDQVYAQLAKDRRVADLALDIAQQFGGIGAAQQFMATLQDPSATVEARTKALRGLAGRRQAELAAEIPALLEDPRLRVGAIRAVAAFDDYELGVLLLRSYDTLSTDEKLAVVQTLSSRPIYGRLLATAIENGHIPRRDIPAYSARQLHRVLGSGFLEIWGPITRFSSEKRAALSKYTRLLEPGTLATADLDRGEQMFGELCAVCHQMYGEGGLVGPDITGSNRTDLDYLLTNVVDPSGDIQDDYQTVMVTTRDGRTYSGTISAESDRALTLRVVGEDPVVISKADIQSRDVFPLSMMPEGLLDPFTDAEVVDLIAYVMTADQPSGE